MAASSYPLQALLSVRHYREEAAQNALRLAERMLAQAREEVNRRQEELERYRLWRPEEEERRYAAILGRELSPDQLTDFRAALSELAQAEQQRVMDVTAAQEEVARQEQAVSRARQGIAQARREAAKIEAHRDIWRERDKLECERQEDLEMEEFSSPAHMDDNI